MIDKIAEFETKFGMAQAFGCIDGTYIPIVWSCEHSHDYFCYKQFHSLSVQALCDYKGAYMDNECTWLGSVHDVKVLKALLLAKVCVTLTYLQYFKL